MDFIKRLLGMSLKKALKIQDRNNPHKRYGIVVSSLEELKTKGCMKLGVDQVCSVVLEEDGTEISDEEYFKILPSQTVVLLLQSGQCWNGSIDYLKQAYEKIFTNMDNRQNLISEVNSLLKDDNSLVTNLMSMFADSLQQNVDAENIKDDPHWFEGLQFSCTTKTGAMKRNAKQRVRGYLSKAKELESSMKSKAARSKFVDILSLFRKMLEKDGFFEVYFDRSSKNVKTRFCDGKGWFTCGGAHDQKNCSHRHSINPYGSKETRVLFSTWNLDHQIEKSREVLPTLKMAIETCPETKQINTNYFYELLFTRNNLKLVDIRCHKKTKHSGCIMNQKEVFINC